MITYQLSSAIIGTALGIAILFLVRRDHLQLGRALFWLAFAVASVLFGVVPGLSDRMAAALGISYGPTLVILVALSALVLKSLQTDIQNSRLERKMRRLTQQQAILEAELHDRTADTPKTAAVAKLPRTERKRRMESA